MLALGSWTYLLVMATWRPDPKYLLQKNPWWQPGAPSPISIRSVASGSQPSRSQSHTGRSFKPREHGEQRRTRFSSSSRPWQDGRYHAFSRDVMQQHVREDDHILVQVNLSALAACAVCFWRKGMALLKDWLWSSPLNFYVARLHFLSFSWVSCITLPPFISTLTNLPTVLNSDESLSKWIDNWIYDIIQFRVLQPTAALPSQPVYGSRDLTNQCAFPTKAWFW